MKFGIADEEQRIKVLQTALTKIGDNQSAALGNAWEKIRLLRLKPHPEGGEAEAFCRLTLSAGSRTKLRLWMVKNGDAWQIYDLEMQEESIRLSVTLGAVYAAMSGDDKTKRTMILAFTTLQKAMAKLGEGEAEEAHELLKKALEAEPPALVRAWLELVNGQTLAIVGKYEDAVASADRVLAMQKDLLVAHHLKAAALFELEEYEKCIDSEKEFMKGVGDDAEAWEKIGESYEHLKKADDAIGAYRKGAASDDEEHACRLAAGRLLLEAGKGAEATAPLVEAIRNAKNPEILDQAAELVDRKGEPAALLALAEEQAKATPDEVSVARWKGRALRKLKRFEEAEKVLRAAVAKEEEDHAVEEELIFTLAYAGKEKEAMERLDALAAHEEERAPFLRAYVHAVGDRTAKALEELTKYFDIAEDASYLITLVGDEPVFKKVREDKGYPALVERTKSKSEYSTAVNALLEKEDWEALLKLSRDRAGAAPDHARAHYYQGYALRRLGRFLDAEIALKKAIEKKKDKSEYKEELAKALAAQGRLDEALAVADDLVKSKVKEAGLFLRVAVYAIAKKADPALYALEELLKVDADWAGAVESDTDLEEFCKLQAVKALLKKYKSQE